MVIKKMTVLMVVFVMLFTPFLAEASTNCSTVCDPCGAASAGWQAGYQAGQAMVHAASQFVNGVLCIAGTIISATAGLIAGAACSIVPWIKKGIRKAKALAKKAWGWVKKIAGKVKAKVKKVWAKIKNFWHHLVNCWHNCNPCNDGQPAPTQTRIKQVNNSKIDKNISDLIVRHQEARFRYISDKKYQKKFNSCAKLQQTILNKVNRSIDKRDYFEYDVLMDTIRKLSKDKKNGDNILAFGPILDGVRSKIRTKMMGVDDQERQTLKEMLDEIDYYSGYYQSYAEGFYVKKAVKIPTLK
jgi:CRISPR/Cas system CSM-associated protein Csm2 small subunit